MTRAPASRPEPLDSASKREQAKLLVLFGGHLRALRHEREKTVEQVAAAAGLHPNYLGSIERGERNVALFNIWRIAAALDVPVSALVHELPKRRTAPA